MGSTVGTPVQAGCWEGQPGDCVTCGADPLFAQKEVGMVSRSLLEGEEPRQTRGLTMAVAFSWVFVTGRAGATLEGGGHGVGSLAGGERPYLSKGGCLTCLGGVQVPSAF